MIKTDVWYRCRSLGFALFFVLPACTSWWGNEQTPPAVSRDECVVLLHGMVRTSNSMNRIKESLLAEGYTVVNWGYPSRENPIEVLADEAVRDAVATCRDASIERIHFVTHSMGGILVRYYLSHADVDGLGRVVMISPPNQGSELVDSWSEWPGFEFINGPAGSQLGTGDNSLPLQLGPADFEVGIITGTHTTNPLFSLMIPGADDGKVSVERAKLEGMADFLVVPEAHSFIMQDDEVIGQVIHFLEHGRFYRPDSD